MVLQIRLSDTACLQIFGHSYPGAQSWWKIGEAVSWLPSRSLLSVDEEEEENRFSTGIVPEKYDVHGPTYVAPSVSCTEGSGRKIVCFVLICWQF